MSRLTNQTYRGSVGTDPRFERRLSLVGQSFTGFDWGTRPALSHAVIKHYAKTGRELHAQAVRQGLRGVIRGIVGASRRGAEALQGWHLRRVTYRKLMALDDHQLDDIGLHRGQIPAVVEGSGRDESRPATAPQPYVATVAGPRSGAANDDRPDLAA